MSRSVRRHVIGWVLLLLALGSVPLANAHERQKAVWIDTDPACGVGARTDVDDCFALLYALRSPALRVVGISTVFGNTDLETATETLHALLEQAFTPPLGTSTRVTVHAGASSAGLAASPHGTPASEALATALKAERVTVIALGALTNVATLIAHHPELADRIDAIVAVAGTRPGQRILHPGNTRLLHFHDLNFKLDPIAFETVLRSTVPLVLLPFEASGRIHITASDLGRLRAEAGAPRWLANVSEGWLGFWQHALGAPGFRPFDSLAVGWVATPEHFTCSEERALVRRRRSLFVDRDSLDVAARLEGGRPVLYCSDLSPAFKEELLKRLMAEPASCSATCQPAPSPETAAQARSRQTSSTSRARRLSPIPRARLIPPTQRATASRARARRSGSSAGTWASNSALRRSS